MFVVQFLIEKTTIRIDGCHPPLERKVKLSFIEGMVGAMPVFDSHKNALAYAEDETLILEVVRKHK